MVVILMYHMVRDARWEPDARYCCSPRKFRLQMAYLRLAGYRVAGLGDVAKLLGKGDAIPRGTVSITFDDGFRDNYEHAWPVLKRHGYPATMFVVSGLAGRTNEWMRREAWPARYLASWEEIREMAGEGIEIGSHTESHAALTECDAETLAREVRESKAEIERRIGKPARFFAYPYGLLDERAPTAVAAAGYEAACSTRSGFNGPGADPFALRRLEVYGSDSLWRFAVKIAWGTNDATLRLIGRYYLSRVRARLGRWVPAWT